jgi:hypothetical protein
MIDEKLCKGCYEDFYNEQNRSQGGCWCRDKARIKTRYKLSIDSPRCQYSAYEKVVVPDCYHVQRFVFVDQIPNHAK